MILAFLKPNVSNTVFRHFTKWSALAIIKRLPLCNIMDRFFISFFHVASYSVWNYTCFLQRAYCFQKFYLYFLIQAIGFPLHTFRQDTVCRIGCVGVENSFIISNLKWHFRQSLILFRIREFQWISDLRPISWGGSALNKFFEGKLDGNSSNKIHSNIKWTGGFRKYEYFRW